MRIVLAALIWLLDLLLKFGLGYAAVFLAWWLFSAGSGRVFGLGWVLAGGLAGACVNGLFEGCDIILLGWAKRVAAER